MLVCNFILLLSVLIAAAPLLRGQSLMQGAGPVRMLPSDASVLDTPDPRKDMDCTVTPVKPSLGFDLKFHGGYDVTVPLKDLVGPENMLTMVFRVTPEDRKDEPAYFVQHVRVPPIEEDASGSAYLQGMFDLGEGKYHVDWLMRDRAERFCSSYWDTEAVLAQRDQQLNLDMAPETVQAADQKPFREEPPVERIEGEPSLDVKVLVNFAPQNQNAATLQPLDTAALLSILRGISREPRIGRFSLVAFNLQEQRVLYRQDKADRIDFPALGEALQSLNLGTVDLRRLSQKNGETDFLAALIQKELGRGEHPDALIFAGPKAMLDENVSVDSLKEVGEVNYPVFYMNYNLDPQAVPWRDAISRAVRFFKGYEFTISRPRDLWTAMTEVVARTVRYRDGRRAAAAASQ